MSRNTIGRVAERAGVGVETVRFYERRGLIRRPPAPREGFREYPDDVVDRIRFIRHGKELGFSLSEIEDLLSLRSDPRGNCDEVRDKVLGKISDVDAKIGALQRIRSQLEEFVASCEERARSGECPVLEALD